MERVGSFTSLITTLLYGHAADRRTRHTKRAAEVHDRLRPASIEDLDAIGERLLYQYAAGGPEPPAFCAQASPAGTEICRSSIRCSRKGVICAQIAPGGRSRSGWDEVVITQ